MVIAGVVSDPIILIDSDKYFASTERLSYTNLMTPDFIYLGCVLSLIMHNTGTAMKRTIHIRGTAQRTFK